LYLLYLGPLFPVPLFCPVSYATTERLSHTNPSLERKRKANQIPIYLIERGGRKEEEEEEGTPVGLTHVGRERES
jgi:hypothetical protein